MQFMSRTNLARVLICVLPVLACTSETEDPVSFTQSAVMSKTADPTNYYNFAVAINVGADDKNSAFKCSGTLIAPNLVLTAKHCVTNSTDLTVRCDQSQLSGDIPPEQIQITVRTRNDTFGQGWYTAKEYIEPTWTGVCGADLVLIVLNKNVPSSESTPAAPLLIPPATIYTGKVTVVGYGETEALREGFLPDYGIRRVFDKALIKCTAEAPTLECEKDNGVNLTKKEFMTYEGACSGDSGAGAINSENFALGKIEVMGVYSRGKTAGFRCTDNIFIRTDAWGDFIAAGAKYAATLGKYEPPAWSNFQTAAGTVPRGSLNNKAIGELGADCQKDAECGSGVCQTRNNGRTRECSKPCSATDVCPTDFKCLGATGSTNTFCFYEKAAVVEETGCCTSTVGKPISSSNAIFVSCIGALALAVRRRERSKSRVK